jgi:2',3'-cyclic-nucleotide 2'-phosphodiesterase (5'-nucleotidase family)
MIITEEFLKLVCYYVIYFDKYCKQYDPINLTDYDYPRLDNDNIYSVSILGTNDIHGFAFAQTIQHPSTGEQYKYGGLEYMASYINIMRKEWGDRFLWIDSGDQFQGGMESKISNGTIMTDFFNYMKVNSASIGNHEWDFGQNFLFKRLEEADFSYLAANIFDNQTQRTEFLPNTKIAKIFTLGEIKIGVIGISTVETPFTTSGDLTGVRFAEYRDIVIELSAKLRADGANAVIINSHVGMNCFLDKDAKMVLRLRDLSTHQEDCNDNDEINKLLKSLNPGVIDAVIGGHVHDVVHHWVNGVPVIQSINGGFYSNILYLRFDRSSKKLIPSQTVIEGPLPTCEKIFQNTKRCNYVHKEIAETTGPLLNYIFHNQLVKPDISLQTMFVKWWNEVEKYKQVLAHTDVEMARIDSKENLLGNFISDAIRNISDSDISVINNGAFRSTWYPGNILVQDVYEMLPFENIINSWKMTGKEVKKMISIIQSGKKALYQISGLNIKMKQNPYKVLDIKLYDGSELIDDKVYKVGGIDFEIPFGGDDFKDVISWYKPVEVKTYGLLRNNMIEYLKSVQIINVNDYLNPNHRRIDFGS